MRLIEGIFYTNLDYNVSTQFIAEIKQKEIIDEYTIFVIFYDYYNNHYQMIYRKYWKSYDCVILNIFTYLNYVSFSNGKHVYLKNTCNMIIDEFKKMCDDYDLLKSYIKFIHGNYNCYVLNDNHHFYFRSSLIEFNGKKLSITEFIEEILTNYPEFCKYDYSQIKPAVGSN